MAITEHRTVFKTRDGAIFTELAEAEKHEIRAAILEELDATALNTTLGTSHKLIAQMLVDRHAGLIAEALLAKGLVFKESL